MGFSEGTFKPSYGLAETTLAATFSPPGQGLLKHTIDMDRYERTSEAVEANEITNVEHKRTFVACGLVLPGHEVEIRDFEGNVLGGNKVGKICLRGPSVSPGYFRNTQATEASFSSDGWLDTGDLGYWLDNQLVVTGLKILSYGMGEIFGHRILNGPPKQQLLIGLAGHALLLWAVQVIKKILCFY